MNISETSLFSVQDPAANHDGLLGIAPDATCLCVARRQEGSSKSSDKQLEAEFRSVMEISLFGILTANVNPVIRDGAMQNSGTSISRNSSIDLQNGFFTGIDKLDNNAGLLAADFNPLLPASDKDNPAASLLISPLSSMTHGENLGTDLKSVPTEGTDNNFKLNHLLKSQSGLLQEMNIETDTGLLPEESDALLSSAEGEKFLSLLKDGQRGTDFKSATMEIMDASYNIRKQPPPEDLKIESVSDAGIGVMNSNNLQGSAVVSAAEAKDAAAGVRVISEPLIQQVGSKIGVFLKDGISKATINLDPPSLGHLKVDIIVKDNVVRASITADNPAVKEVLKVNLQGLTDALMKQGLAVSELTVFLGDRSSGYREGFDFMPEGGGDRRHTEDNQSSADTWFLKRKGSDGVVDIFV
ncbi:MAG: flagellar hook-length control protein FliK [Deltaproteobacteria bacterium]|nr:flagellar hook-length control protein FliK [Deltaproteobacteria bacterium]